MTNTDNETISQRNQGCGFVSDSDADSQDSSIFFGPILIPIPISTQEKKFKFPILIPIRKYFSGADSDSDSDTSRNVLIVKHFYKCYSETIESLDSMDSSFFPQ